MTTSDGELPHPAPSGTETSLPGLDAACPHLFFEKARNAGPVYFVESIGAWLLTQAEDIREVVADTARFSHRYPAGPKYAAMMRDTMGAVLAAPGASPAAVAAAKMGRWEVLFTADSPNHERQRSLALDLFSPRQIRLAEPQVREIAERLVSGFAKRGRVELVREFAWPLPLEVITRRLGVPLDHLPVFRKWAEDMASMLGSRMLTHAEMMPLLQSLGEFHTYFEERIEEARDNPKEDILGMLVQREGKLSRQEMLGMLVQFLVAGHETSTNLISSAMLRIARSAELAHRLREDPAQIPAFIEEVLRLDAPAQGTFRRTKQDVVLSGVTIQAGDHIFLPFALANRDPGSYADPHQVDLKRAASAPHLSFGKGVHFCLGAPLARLEGRVAVEVLLNRLDQFRADDAALEYNISFMIHGLRQLPLHFSHR